MTISGDDFEDRRSTRERTSRETGQTPSSSEAELIAQGYVIRGHYDYTAIDHTCLYAVRRYEHTDIPGHKEIRQGKEDGPSDWLRPYEGVRVPYRWPELHAADPARPVYWTEGEKDADTLTHPRHGGLIATTAAGQKLSAVICKALRGFQIVVLVDNDSKGEENAEKAVKAFRPYAASLRVVRLPRLEHGEDVTDWLDLRDGSIEELERIVTEEPCVIEEAKRNAGRASPLMMMAGRDVQRREWLYKPAYTRGDLSMTVGAGARGKSSLIIAEALAMASGKALHGIQPPKPLNVWYVNLEDNANELMRRFVAAATHFEVMQADIGERLFVDSGQIVIAGENEKRRVMLDQAAIAAIRRTIRERKIDVAIFDPFVSMHRVNENDNGAIDMVAKALRAIAEHADCAIMLVHHTRKPNGEAGGTDDTRGASALTNAARFVRVLNPMTKEEAERLGIDPDKRGFYFSATNGKTNVMPPAESRDWYKLESVELGNGGGFETEGDNVGVVTRFAVGASGQADRLRNLGETDIREVFRVGGPWRFDPQARSQWAGDHLALALGIDLAANKARLNKAIRDAVSKGRLHKYRDRAGPGNTSADRKLVDWVRLADSAPPLAGGAAEMGGAE